MFKKKYIFGLEGCVCSHYSGNPNLFRPVNTNIIPATQLMKLIINLLLMLRLPIVRLVSGTKVDTYPTTPMINAPSIMKSIARAYLRIALLTKPLVPVLLLLLRVYAIISPDNSVYISGFKYIISKMKKIHWCVKT